MTSKKQIHHPAWIEIDTQQFRENIRLIRNYIGKTLYCLPVKANAYGHGLVPMAKIAEEEKVDYLAVAHLIEGIELRKAGITLPILVFGAIHEEQISDLIKFNLEFSISSPFKAKFTLEKARELNKIAKVHIEIETGMQRTGMRPKTALTLIQEIKNDTNISIIGVYSHLATSDVPNDVTAEHQYEIFKEFLLNLAMIYDKPLIRHIANSGGTLYYKHHSYDMVRPGILSFGYISNIRPKELEAIRPCFSLKARVAYLKLVDSDQGVSYGHTYHTKSSTRLATIPVGYGDGYRRSLSNRGFVLIQGCRFPIVGVICMDQFMVDIDDSNIHVGDEVVLIGHQGNEEISLEEVSQLLGSIPYETLCAFGNRLPRLYSTIDEKYD